MLCSRLVIKRQGYALIVALGLVMAVLFVRGLPPVNVLLRLMANATNSADLIAPAGGLLAIAAVVLISSSIVPLVGGSVQTAARADASSTAMVCAT